MRIMNNMSSVAALGELKKNDTAFSKSMKKLASGTKLNSAGDDASGMVISEKMRVRIRSLDQDSQNVQNGQSLLRIAEGAIQNQLEIVKTIKEKVIDANNDTNTDWDRKLIQKEVDQLYDQMSDITYMTNFNGRQLLIGTSKEEINSWTILSHAVFVDGSDQLKMIPATVQGPLDGVDGPFDLFEKYRTEAPQTKTMSGATPGDPNEIEIDLTGETVASLLRWNFLPAI